MDHRAGSPATTRWRWASSAARPRKVHHQSGILGVSLDDTDHGPRITRVYPQSAARRAKLETGGRDHPHRRPAHPHPRWSSLPGSRPSPPAPALKLTVQRDDKSLTIRVTLGSGSPVPNGNHSIGEFSVRRFGFPSAFEHDAMLTADECGGVLVNLRGQPVGITIARASRTGCYALPAKLVEKYVRDRLGDVSPESE